MLISAGTARAEWLRPLGFLPLLAVNGLLLYGLGQMGDFQSQERPWRARLDRAKLLALVNLGLCPFIYWHFQLPGNRYFMAVFLILELCAGLFLFHLNGVLAQLGAMLPDETLRQETRQFTALNRWLLVLLLGLAVLIGCLLQLPHPAPAIGRLLGWLDQGSRLLLIFLVLLPLAMTMALIWKTKEVILDAVFGPR